MLFRLIILLSFFISCKTINKTNYYKKVIPPGLTKIGDNFYSDNTEVSNLHWMEYMFWNERIFGKKSLEFLSTLPDTAVWSFKAECLDSLDIFYLRHPAYKNYPVVGISQNQAMEYSKWRSDRVFQYYLIKYGGLKNIYHKESNENYFTIERYFSGTYFGIIPDSNFKFYPEYGLPNINERKSILSYSDSLDRKYLNNCKGKRCREIKKNYPFIQSDIITCQKDTFIPTTLDVHSGYILSDDNDIFNVRGNVSEWMFEDELTCGGGWADRKEIILKNDTIRQAQPNAWTGFRNVCTWKEWGK